MDSYWPTRRNRAGPAVRTSNASIIVSRGLILCSSPDFKSAPQDGARPLNGIRMRTCRTGESESASIRASAMAGRVFAERASWFPS